MNHRKFTAVITKEEKWYVGHCLELEVVSQGKTIEEAQANLKEAVELYLESFGSDDPPVTPFRPQPRDSAGNPEAVRPLPRRTPEAPVNRQSGPSTVSRHPSCPPLLTSSICHLTSSA